MELLLKASNFAAIKHKNQQRKDSRTPYINHPIEVANKLCESGVLDVNVLVAALLHDTIEDTNTTYEELTLEFGEKISKIVYECTDDRKLSKVERKKLQIEHAKTISYEAKLVKLSDKFNNLKDISNDAPQHWSKAEIDGYIIWSYSVYQNLKGINIKLEQDFDKLLEILGVNLNDLDIKLQQYYELIKN